MGDWLLLGDDNPREDTTMGERGSMIFLLIRLPPSPRRVLAVLPRSNLLPLLVVVG
jgi:hypothetical protein